MLRKKVRKETVLNECIPDRSVDLTSPGPEAAFHNLEASDVLRALETSDGGLDAGEARRRLSLHGPNELQAIVRTSPWHTLASQFKNVLVLILLQLILMLPVAFLEQETAKMLSRALL